MKYFLITVLLVVSAGIMAQEVDKSTCEYYADSRDGFEIWKHKKTKKYGVVYYESKGETPKIKHPFEYDGIEEELYYDRGLIGEKDGRFYILNAEDEIANYGYDEILLPAEFGMQEFEEQILFLRDAENYLVYKKETGLANELFSEVIPINGGSYYHIAVVRHNEVMGLYDFTNMKYVYGPFKLNKIYYSEEINEHCSREDLLVFEKAGKKGLLGDERLNVKELLSPEYDEISISYLSNASDFPVLKLVKGDLMNLFVPDKKEFILSKLVPESDVYESTYIGDRQFFFTVKDKKQGAFSRDMSIMIPNEYSRIDIHEDAPEMITVQKKGKQGVYMHGKLILPCEYSEIDPQGDVTDSELIRVFKKKKQGMVMNNKLAIPCEYNQIHIDYDGQWFIVAKGKKFGLYHQNQLKLPLEYDRIEFMNGDLGKTAFLVKGEKAWYYSEDGKMEETNPSER